MATAHSTGKAPAFQFYPKDFLSDSNVVAMSMQERGVYITLICVCWDDGSIPSDVAALARLCYTPIKTFQKLWPAVSRCFKLSGDRLVHPRLQKERQKQREYRQRQTDASRKRWDSRPISTGNPTALPSVAIPPQSSASSSSSASASSIKTNVRAFRPSEETDDVSARAGRFCEVTYPALYQKHRKGARYVSKPNLDFLEAVELCRVWDDDRLEKIATVFLTTDHQFAESGSRTMAQFRALASWCDSRLQEAGIA